MSGFAGFVCWEEKTVAATIATEAVSPSDNVFLATHAPLDIHRTTVLSGQTGPTKVVREVDVLNDYLSRPTNKGVLVMPVLGESGAGKSHLVRWVRANTPHTAERQVVYLPKDNTSLAGVVERLLMGREGAPFDEIRADLGRLGRGITPEVLQHDLLDKLGAALLVASPNSPRERALVGEFGLRALLADPFVRSKILRPEGLIARRAAHILDGRGETSGDVPMEFTADDLPLKPEEMHQASQPARKIFLRMATDEHLQAAAYKMLQQYLDVAVMEATNLGVGRVFKAFMEIRRALAGKKEIILLVEDFALVQGVQRDLIEAITETGEREGKQTYAPVRTLMAVTTGYFQDLPPTARTRIDAATTYRYELRVNLGAGSDSDTEQRVTDLMGRYLNAARLGRNHLEAENVRSAETAPNACTRCPHREECHSGFGASSDGFGLYPYNRPALLRVVRAAAPADRPGEFNPRAALAQAIRGVLQDHADDIRNRQFPNDDFEERFPRRLTGSVIPSSVQAEINRADPLNADRRQVLLQYWGDAPTTLVNLPIAIHTAFTLPPLADLSVRRPEDEPDAGKALDRRSPSPQERGKSVYPAGLAKKLEHIEEWNTRSAPMRDDEARDIRSAIRQAIFSQISWTKPLMKEPTHELLDKAWPKQRAALVVSIEGAPETLARGTTPMMRFDRTPENAMFFTGLLKLAAGQREGTLSTRLRLRQIVVQYTPQVRDLVVKVAERGDDAVVAAMRVSLIGAAVAGAVQPGSSPEELLSAAVANLNGHRRSDRLGRSPLWNHMLDRHFAERGELVLKLREAIGTAQGTGGVQAIDAKRALLLVRAAAEEWTLGTGTPAWATKAARALTGAQLETAVTEQVESLAGLLTEIRRRLPAGTSLRETVKAVTAAFETGERASMVLVPDLREIRESNERAADFKSAPVDKLERDLDRLAGAASWPNRLAVAADDRGDDLTRIRDYLAASESWLDVGLQTPLSTESEETKQLVEDLAAATARWSDITARLAGGQA
ncbi:protein DpdH [Micromonospora sp. NPDC005113]